VLSIGSVVGGATPANRGWKDAIGELSRRVSAARAGVASPVRVNVVFHVPGNVVGNDFEGVRTGRFSSSDRLLMVQVSLPEEAPAEPLEHLLQCARDAVDEAERWAQRREHAHDLSALRRILDVAAG